MRIIKNGLDPKPYRWTCRECKSLIEAQRSEGREVVDPRGRREALVVFVCPICQHEQWVSEEKFK